MMMLFAWINIAQATGIRTTELTYVVVHGDTLSDIAVRFNTTWPILKKLNRIKNENLIQSNEVLLLPDTKKLRNRHVRKNQMHIIRKITSAHTGTNTPFLWKNPGRAHCIKCTLVSSVHGLGFPDIVARALVTKVKNHDFTMIKISRGMHFDAMYFGKRILKENIVASWGSGHTEPAREYSVIHDGTRYALIYPLVCGNWSKTTSKVPLQIVIIPAENAKIPDNRIAGTDPPIALEPTPNNIPEQVCITCPDFIVLATFEPLKKRSQIHSAM